MPKISEIPPLCTSKQIGECLSAPVATRICCEARRGQDGMQHCAKSHAASSCLVDTGTYQHWQMAGALVGDAASFKGDNIPYPARATQSCACRNFYHTLRQ